MQIRARDASPGKQTKGEQTSILSQTATGFCSLPLSLAPLPLNTRERMKNKAHGPRYSGASRWGEWLSHTHILFLIWVYSLFRGFPSGSDGKESACNLGDLDLIPGSGRSPGEGNGYPLQNFCLEISMNRGAWRATSPWGCKDTTEKLVLTHSLWKD